MVGGLRYWELPLAQPSWTSIGIPHLHVLGTARGPDRTVKSKFRNQKRRIPALILASASPRRAELLRDAGMTFRVLVSRAHEPERKPAAIPVDLWPMCLAYMKARAVQHHLQIRNSKFENPKSKIPLILAADTIVVNGSQILNKARDRAHARRILQSLQGKTHRVITGICLLRGARVRLASAESVCRVTRVSSAWLEKYLDSGLWRGKAGAYGIQDSHDPFVQLVTGDFSTVVGLPMALVQSEIASFAKD
jgi:septum formation protein